MKEYNDYMKKVKKLIGKICEEIEEDRQGEIKRYERRCELRKARKLAEKAKKRDYGKRGMPVNDDDWDLLRDCGGEVTEYNIPTIDNCYVHKISLEGCIFRYITNCIISFRSDEKTVYNSERRLK